MEGQVIFSKAAIAVTTSKPSIAVTTSKPDVSLSFLKLAGTISVAGKIKGNITYDDD